MQYLEGFRTFKIIHETGTLSDAETTLFTSETGIILHLNSLKAFAGYKLLDRSTSKIVHIKKCKIFYNFILGAIKNWKLLNSIFVVIHNLKRIP